MTLPRSPDVAARRRRLVALGRALPDVDVSPVGAGHLALKAPRLVAADPERFFVPPYLGPKGWVGLRLDGRTLDWKQIRELLLAAHWLAAAGSRTRRTAARPAPVRGAR
jgi:hypothetical protein